VDCVHELVTSTSGPPPTRERNRRGQGDRLRNELIAAATVMVEEGDPLSLRSVARRVGIAATSVYLHFSDLDELLAAVVGQSFGELTAATAEAATGANSPADELRRRCRAYCHFGLKHPNLYRLIFQTDLPQATLGDNPADTPGLRAFDNLVAAVDRALQARRAPPHGDPFRLATLIWTADHGIVLARIARPTFPWPPLELLVDEMVNRIMAFHDQD
jgi:AcrR family transcriptional regulator